METYKGPLDEHGIGAHALLLTNTNGVIEVWDPRTGGRYPLQSHDSGDLAAVTAVIYNPHGQPTVVSGYDTTGATTIGTAGIGPSGGSPRVEVFDDPEEFLRVLADADYPPGTRIDTSVNDFEDRALCMCG